MITLVFDGPGVTPEQYDEVCRLANISPTNVPDGLIFHQACATDNGWLVVDVWESEEKLAAFSERLRPALEQVGLTQEPRIYKTHLTMGQGVPAQV
jgi:hypothetical protein